MTSLAFMFVEVPLPVWKMSTGNSLSYCPSTTCSAAASIEAARVAGRWPMRPLTIAAALLIIPNARINDLGNRFPLIWKLWIARAVCGP